MAILNLPAPALTWADDGASAFLPPAARLAVWALVAAVASMEVYRVVSPQARVAAMRMELKASQERLASYDGEFDGAWPLIRRMLGLALGRVGLVVPATLVAALPLVVLLVWLDSTYAHRFPGATESVAVSVSGDFDGQWANSPGAGGRVVVSDAVGELVMEVVPQAPIPVVHRPRWWNTILANPAGYLPQDAPFDRVDMNLPRIEVLSSGPEWLRRWEFVFFPALLVAAIAYKMARRIE